MRRGAGWVALAAVLSLATVAAGAAQPAGGPVYGRFGLDLTAMDPSVAPGEDFNRYASGAWLARTAIPADKPSASLRYDMTDRTEARLHGIMERAAAASPAHPASLADKVGVVYAAFMDQARIEALGASPIAPDLTAVSRAGDRAALAGLMGRAPAGFEASVFSVGIDVDLKDTAHYAVYLGQAGLGLPDRDYYLLPKFATQKAAYQAYAARLLALVAWPKPQAAAAAVVALETGIAQASWSKAQQRDVDKTYNRLSRAELDALAPGFAWTPFLDAAGLGRTDHVVVAEKSAFPQIAAIYQASDLETLKAWQAFHIADHAAFYLAAPFSSARFDFRDKTLSGQPLEEARWKRAVRAVGGGDCQFTDDLVDCAGLRFGVGQLYTAAYFPPASKAKIEALVAEVKAAMRARLERLDWMGAETKTQALHKLDTYRIKVGYPDRPRDYSGLEVRQGDLVGDVARARAFEWRYRVARLDGAVDRDEWGMTPQTNDAYNGLLRDIVFPAAILQAPMFDPAADPAVNYGAIGGVIGHELTHGFDDEGRKLDADGRLRDWWTAADAAAFEARAKRLGAQYDAYEPVPGAHINGELTMGENIADLGGVNVALEAYHRSLHGSPAPTVDGLSGDQRVLLGWAQAWRGKSREDALRRQVVSDPHSARAFRVIGPARNIDAWYDAFGVKPGQTYYLAPQDRVRIW